jgi:glycosyltransferase involved in cell wall biosynthesis
MAGTTEVRGSPEQDPIVKLIIQIPCLNEAANLSGVVSDLPKVVPHVDSIEVLVIDDGSTDGTADVARAVGADHVIQLPQHRGLAAAFARGLTAALDLGADIIVNTDGDHQYRGDDIAPLVMPILEGHADMVVGDRQVDTIPHFSRVKKWLQKAGSLVVRWASRTSVPDATSGFRAFSREAALRLEIFSTYTYTLETIIQAGRKGLTVVSVPVRVNTTRRRSRLIQSVPGYVLRSAVTILRVFLMYEAMRVFFVLGALPFLAGSLLVARFLYFFSIGDGTGHIQSLIIASILIVLGFQTFLLGLLGDLIAKNRHLSEETNYRLKKAEFGRSERHVL